jgi:ankyrin repeat protein
MMAGLSEDAIDFISLTLSCKAGDIAKVRYYVEVMGVPINVQDKWSATPLYYACLCGHYQVAEYLLEKGEIGFFLERKRVVFFGVFSFYYFCKEGLMNHRSTL